MTAEILTSKLEKVKQVGPFRWQARCPAHDDKGPSLSIRETDDGRVLVHCFAGCSVHEIVQAAGLELADLFPPRPGADHSRPERQPFPAADVLRAVAFESLVVSAAAASLLAGEPFGVADRERLILAVSRINAAMTAAGVRHVG